MLPEISRRCLVCGASARVGGRFCPQCGGDLLAREVEREPGGAGHEAAERGSGIETREAGAPDEALPALEVPPARAGATVMAERERREFPPTREAAADATREGVAVAGSPADSAPAESAAADSNPAESEPVGARQGAGPAADEEDEGEAGEAGETGWAGNRRERAAARVRGVKDNLKPRVERMRDDALVALEDTRADSDSGLRFVIIAVGLFLVFIVFLILNVYVLG
ncbi:MAG TPA: zinc ribbon domain-containing protein [Pyrinomonadaceae bacterium]|nr:zinc ribbon domain-containing protein [Pyrinomonadaceae bacterium]